MPRNSQVPGPALVDAQINQDPDISQQITLLGQASSGSRVRLGSLLVIPVNQSLLFIRPLYLEAERTAQPQFKKVIVVYANRAVMKDTLREAFVELFGAAPETLEAGQTQPPPEQPQTPTQPGRGPIVERATPTALRPVAHHAGRRQRREVEGQPGRVRGQVQRSRGHRRRHRGRARCGGGTAVHAGRALGDHDDHRAAREHDHDGRVGLIRRSRPSRRRVGCRGCRRDR